MSSSFLNLNPDLRKVPVNIGWLIADRRYQAWGRRFRFPLLRFSQQKKHLLALRSVQ